MADSGEMVSEPMSRLGGTAADAEDRAAATRVLEDEETRGLQEELERMRWELAERKREAMVAEESHRSFALRESTGLDVPEDVPVDELVITQDGDSESDELSDDDNVAQIDAVRAELARLQREQKEMSEALAAVDDVEIGRRERETLGLKLQLEEMKTLVVEAASKHESLRNQLEQATHLLSLYRMSNCVVSGSELALKPDCLTVITGARVLVHGLQSRPELNGREGTVVCCDEASKRFYIDVDETASDRSALRPKCEGDESLADVKEVMRETIEYYGLKLDAVTQENRALKQRVHELGELRSENSDTGGQSTATSS